MTYGCGDEFGDWSFGRDHVTLHIHQLLTKIRGRVGLGVQGQGGGGLGKHE
jgi:hypothetical protein